MKIRFKSFETNSSSSHSLGVTVDDFDTEGKYLNLKDYLNDDGGLAKGVTYDLWTVSAGWGPEVYAGVLNKLKYLYTYFLTKHGDYNWELESSREGDYYTDDNSFANPTLEGVDDFHNILNILKEKYECDFNLMGGTNLIDHQSMGNITASMNNKVENFIEMLSNDRYIIVIDNDNSCNFDCEEGEDEEDTGWICVY